jgi:hypothetical protein
VEDPYKKIVDSLLHQMGDMYQASDRIAEFYSEIAMTSPLEAIRALPAFLEKVRDINPERAYESLAGGPNPDWTTPLFNVVGSWYPHIDETVRREGLKQSMKFLDGLNYVQAQDHVAHIHEPWLIGDIFASSGALYWPGFGDYKKLLSQYRNWEEIADNIETIHSKGLLACAILWNEYPSLEIRTNFYAYHQEITDRTLDLIAAMIAKRAKMDSRGGEGNYQEFLEKRITERLPGYDSFFHDDIKRKIAEAKWIDLQERP